MVAELVAVAVILIAAAAELIHAKRCKRLATLAFGPTKRPSAWATAAPYLRVLSLSALTWGMTTLLLIQPKIHQAEVIDERDLRHVLLVLDVSPSMRLQDAGPTGKQSRLQRASNVMDSFFNRVPIEQYRMSVIATYNGAKAVVVDTKDMDVVRNILNDLPMHYAFPVGKTDLFAGLEEAAIAAKHWKPRSATLLIVSDGDTVPRTGMPKLPASIANVLVVGVGDHKAGKFIDGGHSRQDTSTLRQIAVRLRGTYHNGNEKHLSTELIQELTHSSQASPFEKLSRREYALLACGVGALIYALLPLLLHYFGTTWKPGIQSLQRATRHSTRTPSYAKS